MKHNRKKKALSFYLVDSVVVEIVKGDTLKMYGKEKQHRFSIRKLTVGTCSVVVAAFLAGSPQANAEETIEDIVTEASDSIEDPSVGNDEVEDEAELEEILPAADEAGEADGETAQVHEEVAPESMESEWESISPIAGDTEGFRGKDGTGYTLLASTEKHDTENNPAIFENKTPWQVDDNGNAVVDFEFIDGTTESPGNFGVYLHHKDINNYILVGYDPQGWYWEYKR